MPPSKRWSRDVTQKSDALDLEVNVFTKERPREIALSLKRSADHSKRRKSDPYRSAMSMLTFYINRAGKNLEREDGGRDGRQRHGEGEGRAETHVSKGLSFDAGLTPALVWISP